MLSVLNTRSHSLAYTAIWVIHLLVLIHFLIWMFWNVGIRYCKRTLWSTLSSCNIFILYHIVTVSCFLNHSLFFSICTLYFDLDSKNDFSITAQSSKSSWNITSIVYNVNIHFNNPTKKSFKQNSESNKDLNTRQSSFTQRIS